LIYELNINKMCTKCLDQKNNVKCFTLDVKMNVEKRINCFILIRCKSGC
jgi:hypothetical protein